MSTAQGLPVWVIYDGPADYPGRVVVRVQYASSGGVVLARQPAGVVATLREARELIPAGLALFERQETDDPVIVECWL